MKTHFFLDMLVERSESRAAFFSSRNEINIYIHLRAGLQKGLLAKGRGEVHCVCPPAAPTTILEMSRGTLEILK